METGIDGFGRWTIASQKKWMVGCLLFNTATLTILLANFGPYGNFINGIEHEPREEFRDYAYLRICAKVNKHFIDSKLWNTQRARKFKRVQAKRLLKSNKSKIFFVKLHFWQF